MNIVFVTNELALFNNSSGGAASFTSNMARIFAEQGHRVSIVLASTKEMHVELQKDIDIISLYVPMKKWTEMDKLSKVLCRMCKEDKDIVRRMFMSLYKARQIREAVRCINRKNNVDIILYCSNRALNLLSPKGIPYIVRISGFINICEGGANTPDGSVKYENNPLSIKDKLEKYAIKKAKYVVAPSYLLAGIAKENLGLDVTVIESPFVLKTSEWDYSVFSGIGLNEKKYIIHYGNMRYLKGSHIVAKIAKRLLQAYPDLYLVLAGKNGNIVDEDGNKITPYELVRKNAGEYADRVIYAGRLVREQLYPFIEKAELCLLPSRIENLSNACIEAMAMGKIVVATNGASYEQLIDDRISGFLCERDNADSYLKAIYEALNMKTEEKEKMCSEAKKVTRRLEPQKIYQQYLKFFERVIREW